MSELIIPEKVNEMQALIAQAIDKSVPVETMEKLLAMRREARKEFAKEQFDLAMSKLQGEMPIIKKNKPGGKTKSGTIVYYYAPIESIVEQTKQFITDNGFSYSVQTETLVDGVKVTCTVKHLSGHQELSTIQVPLGRATDIMSAPQQVASALTFAKRYAFCNAFGIMTGDDDDDASNQETRAKNNNVPLNSVNKATIAQKKPLTERESLKIKIFHLSSKINPELEKTLNYKEFIEGAINLSLEEKNYAEIADRLSSLLEEKNKQNQNN